MFTDMSFASIEADHHRQQLLAEAATYRLARVARLARRAARRTQRSDVPRPPDPWPTEQRNAGADRRYPVSR